MEIRNPQNSTTRNKNFPDQLAWRTKISLQKRDNMVNEIAAPSWFNWCLSSTESSLWVS